MLLLWYFYSAFSVPNDNMSDHEETLWPRREITMQRSDSGIGGWIFRTVAPLLVAVLLLIIIPTVLLCLLLIVLVNLSVHN